MNKDPRYPLISVRNVIKMEKWGREVNFYWQKTNEIKNSSRRKETRFFSAWKHENKKQVGKRQKETMTVGTADAVNKGKKIFSFTSLFLQNSQMWKIWQTKAWNTEQDGSKMGGHETHILGETHTFQRFSTFLGGYLTDRTRPDFQGYDVIIRFYF